MTSIFQKVTIAGAVVLIFSGCSKFRTPDAPECEPHAGYQHVKTEQPLRAPPGLELPEQASSTPMPSGPRAAVIDGPDGRCLESPPSYFAQPGRTADPGLPVAQTIGVDERGAGDGPKPVLVAGASVLTNEVAAFLDQWARVWTQRNVEEYFQFYASDFVPAGYDSHDQWQETQRERFQVQAQTEVVLNSLKTDTRSDGAVEAEFVQRFGVPPDYRSVLKQMTLEKGGAEGWLIRSERILDVL